VSDCAAVRAQVADWAVMITRAARMVNASAKVSRIRTPLRSTLLLSWGISLLSLLMRT
jgi:hypothetical protein